MAGCNKRTAYRRLGQVRGDEALGPKQRWGANIRRARREGEAAPEGWTGRKGCLVGAVAFRKGPQPGRSGQKSRHPGPLVPMAEGGGDKWAQSVKPLPPAAFGTVSKCLTATAWTASETKQTRTN